jgi:two-component system, LytTR family, response regulator
MKLSVLVVDDEPIARQAVTRLLGDDPDVAQLTECGDGASAVAALRAGSPDLVFLDIQMPAMSGLDVVRTVGAERMPATVFVTAYEEYAVKAFEAHAVDYLVKPFGRDRFMLALERAKGRVGRPAVRGEASTRLLQALDALRRRDQYIERIPIRDSEQITFVDVSDIVWIKASRNTVLIHLADRVHEMRETMSSLAERLDPRVFARVHRSAIVNVRRVQTVHPWFNGHHVLTMDTGQKLRMSRYQHEAFLKLVSL